MAIKGLTDRGSAFPEIGQIRKGAAKDPGGNRPGKDLPYFRVEFDGKDPRGEKFVKIYGTTPTDINVLLPFNEIERNWDAWYEAYTAGRMVARSDGENFTYLVDIKTGEHVVINGLDKNGVQVPHREIVGSYQTQKGGTEQIKMKPVGRLKIVIPELQSLAYLTVHTTSIYDIMNISSQLEAIQQMNSGRIAGVPLVMRRRKKMISTPDLNDKSKRVRREKFLISIEADPDWVKKMLMHVKRLALPDNGLNLLPETVTQSEPEEYKQLPAGSDNDDDDDYDAYGDDVRAGEFEEPEATPEIEHEQPSQEPQAEIVVPDAVSAAMRVIFGKTTLGAMSADDLAKLVSSTTAAAGLKKFAKIVLDWKSK
jgi:hypothetical protein